MEAPAPFSTRHLYSSGHRQWHSTWCCAPSWLFRGVRPQAVMNMYRPTRDGASSEYVIKEQTHCNFNQYHNIQHRQAMGRISSYKTEIRFAVRKWFFLWHHDQNRSHGFTTFLPIHTKISFRGDKNTVLLSSPITPCGNEILDVWSFTPISLRAWVSNPRPAATFANYIYCKNYTLTYEVVYTICDFYTRGRPRAHSNRCGLLTNNVGHPCLRLYVQAEEWKDRLILMTSISHFLTYIRIACKGNGSCGNSMSRFRSKCCGSIRAIICMLSDIRKSVSSIITHQQMHQIHFLFKLSFNNSH
jgi:hypothetical protein